jgi:hypothetical protein
MRRKQIYIALIALVIGFLASMPFWYEEDPPKPRKRKLDWTPTFKKTETKPYANLILYQMLNDLFPNKEILPRTKVAPQDTTFYNLGKRYNLFYANIRFDDDYHYLQALHHFVQNGGEAFIACNYVPYTLIELLDRKINIGWQEDSKPLKVNFLAPALKSSVPYEYPNIRNYGYFSQVNYRKHSILATDQAGRAVFIRVPVGEGNFYFCSVPLAFTNFGMVDKRNYEFVSKSLSYLPVRDVLWEDMPQFEMYYKGNEKSIPEGIKELAFLKKHPSLWWAFCLACASVLLFIIFRAKREQRPIPIVEKPANSSVEFAQTIGRLYFNYQDHKNLAEKKILYCMDFIRNHLKIPIHDSQDRQWIAKIAQKTAISEMEIREMFDAMQNCREKGQITPEELIALNQKINEFRRKAL